MHLGLIVTILFCLCGKNLSLHTDSHGGLSRFSNNLYKKSADASNGNVVISPYSIATALALISQGAVEKTFEQIANGLDLPSDRTRISEVFHKLSGRIEKETEPATLHVANKIYVKEGYQIQNGFKTAAQTKFHSSVEMKNFDDSELVAESINKWIQSKTNNKIDHLIDPNMIDESTRLLLVNAIYFQAKWRNPFIEQDTRPGNFYVNRQNVTVQFMRNVGQYKYADLRPELDATAIEIPYSDSNATFIVVLPNTRDGLRRLESKLVEYDLIKLSEKLERQQVQITIPRFKIEQKTDLKNLLKELGFIDMFSNKADFKDLLSDPYDRIQVSDMVHKAFIDVNERGTEASAATGVTWQNFSARPLHDIDFIADHPFLFFIRQFDTTLFAGRVTQF